MHDYSFSARQGFSHNRWACVGEAAVFPDPVYSQGSDLIAIANTLVARLIELSFSGGLTEEVVDIYDTFFLRSNELATYNLQFSYPFHHRDIVMVCKLIWDVTTGWAFACPSRAVQRIRPRRRGTASGPGCQVWFRRTSAFDETTVSLIGETEASAHTLSTSSTTSTSQSSWRSTSAISRKGNQCRRSSKTTKLSMNVLEELAQVIFLLAVEDVYPEMLSRFQEPIWVNAWKIDLDPRTWEESGLLEPTTQPRRLDDMRRQIRGCFRLS